MSDHGVARGAEGIECECGGYAKRVDCTPAEIEKYGCGRSYECCSRAFVCALCKTRILMTADAPDLSVEI